MCICVLCILCFYYKTEFSTTFLHRKNVQKFDTNKRTGQNLWGNLRNPRKNFVNLRNIIGNFEKNFVNLSETSEHFLKFRRKLKKYLFYSFEFSFKNFKILGNHWKVHSLQNLQTYTYGQYGKSSKIFEDLRNHRKSSETLGSFRENSMKLF